MKKIIEFFKKNIYFKRTDFDLEKKWWHRAIIVAFFIWIPLFFISSIVITYSFMMQEQYVQTIKENNLQLLKNGIDFARKNPDSDLAIELRKRIESGMYNNELNQLKNQPVSFDEFLKRSGGTSDEVKVLNNAEEERALVHPFNEFKKTDKIKEALMYLEVFTISLLLTFLMALLLQIIYFKGFIYIIYGKELK